MDRRTFVKGSVGLGTAAALGAFGLGAGRPVSDVQVDIVPLTFPAIRVIKGSPAPYGLPLVPTTIDSDGQLVGIPDAAESQLDWYKYCSHERAEGLTLEATDDNVIRYSVTQEKIAKGFDAWFKDYLEQPIIASEFPLPHETVQDGIVGPHGAAGRWRSEGVEAEDTITTITNVVPKADIKFEKLSGFTPAQIEEWFPEHPRDPDSVFVTVVSFCTHFCCVPGWKETDLAKSSSRGPYEDLWNTIFCTCHLSAYDPVRIQTYDRNIFIFKDDAAGGGGGGGGH